MSTNDTVMLISTGENKEFNFSTNTKILKILENELTNVCS